MTDDPTPSPSPVAPVARKSGVVVPREVAWYQRLAARLIWLAVRCIAVTLRFRVDDPTGLFTEEHAGRPVIFSIWHNRSSLSMIIYERYVCRPFPRRRLAGLASASKDGALVARVMELFNVHPVRGSTSRRGPQALLELTGCARRGFDIAFTPDGPRGPRYRVQDGVVAAAQICGLPLVPVSYRLSWKWRLKTWDGYQIPLPFARVEVRTGEPLYVPRETPPEDREKFRSELEKRMLAITED